MEQNTILKTALHNLGQAAGRLQLDDTMLARLSEPKEKIEITANPALASGRNLHFKAFVVRHNDAIGPAKGGIRMLAGVSVDDVTGLSMEMTWKTSLIGVPFGGAKAVSALIRQVCRRQIKKLSYALLLARCFVISGRKYIYQCLIWERMKWIWGISVIVFLLRWHIDNQWLLCYRQAGGAGRYCRQA